MATSPRLCALREAQEETGLRITAARRVFDAYMSPGGGTETIACFVAPYRESDRVGRRRRRRRR